MRTIQRWMERVDDEQVHGEDALRDPVEVAQSMATKNEPATPRETWARSRASIAAHLRLKQELAGATELPDAPNRPDQTRVSRELDRLL